MWHIFKLLSAILHLGNVKFEGKFADYVKYLFHSTYCLISKIFLFLPVQVRFFIFLLNAFLVECKDFYDTESLAHYRHMMA